MTTPATPQSSRTCRRIELRNGKAEPCAELAGPHGYCPRHTPNHLVGAAQKRLLTTQVIVAVHDLVTELMTIEKAGTGTMPSQQAIDRVVLAYIELHTWEHHE